MDLYVFPSLFKMIHSPHDHFRPWTGEDVDKDNPFAPDNGVHADSTQTVPSGKLFDLFPRKTGTPTLRDCPRSLKKGSTLIPMDFSFFAGQWPWEPDKKRQRRHHPLPRLVGGRFFHFQSPGLSIHL